VIAVPKSLSAGVSPVAESAAPPSSAWRIGAALAMIFGFVCFMPYPAIPIGRQSALQIGNLLAPLLLIPALALPWRHRPIYLFPLILAPLVLSAVKAGLMGSSDLDLCVKAVGVWAIACLTLVVTQLYAPRYGLWLLTGIAAATLVHAAVGVCQIYSFSQAEFPFVGLYVNQSFLSVADNADTIARYVQRPFGIFPEPSAMACSLAPWICFWVAELCGVVRLRDQPARWQRILFAAAAAGGLGLIILSSSGHTMITLAALVLIVIPWFRRLKATPRTFAIVLPMLCIVVPLVLWAASTMMSDRIAGESQASGSWDDRSTSLIVGFSLYAHGDLPTILFGLGVGLSPTAVWNAAGLDAVWSVLLCYFYETGLIGAVVICLIGAYLLRAWRASRLNLAFAAITVVWLVGITLTTSYPHLLPIWVALGWLTVWPAICAPGDPPPARKRTIALGQRDLEPPSPHRQSWTVPREAVNEATK
jgi:hypothetical protein